MLGFVNDLIKYSIAPSGVPVRLGLFIGALSMIALMQFAFDYGLGPMLALLFNYYDRLISVPASWVEPYIEMWLVWLGQIVDWKLELHPHWKHIFLLFSMYFFRNAANDYRIGLIGASAINVLLGLFIAIVTSIGTGVISVTHTDIVANFMIAAIPVSSTFVYQLFNALWAAGSKNQERWTTYASRSDAATAGWWASFWPDFKSLLWFLVGRIALIGLGLQLPVIRAQPSPGLTLLGLMFIVHAIYLLWLGIQGVELLREEGKPWRETYWRLGSVRVGGAMLGVFFWVTVLLLANAGLGLMRL